MQKFQIKSYDKVNMVELDQAGDDVIVRVNGYGLIALRTTPEGKRVEVARNVADELGILPVETGIAI
jgi:hypothetical protein